MLCYIIKSLLCSYITGSITRFQTCPKASICVGPINCSLIGTPFPHKNGGVGVILHDPQGAFVIAYEKEIFCVLMNVIIKLTDASKRMLN